MAENGVNGTEKLQNGIETDSIQNGHVENNMKTAETDKNGIADTSSLDMDRARPQGMQPPQEKVIYKGDGKSVPSPSINLGVWGKIPIHTLSDMYLDTVGGCMLTLSEAKRSRSIGGWVYAGAACLAKYLESICCTDPPPEGGSLRGKRLIELGAGTGVVGVLAGYYGADTIITDMDNIVPLIDYNIKQNAAHMKGKVEARGLVWGEDASELLDRPVDYLILANCVYYESSLEPLATTMKQLASVDTEILVCYEERTQGIRALIGRWHELIEDDFHIEYLPNSCICEEFKEDYVRLLRMKKKT